MDSKSVHRVAASLQLKAHFDSKLKLWNIDDKTFTSAEVSNMASTTLRAKLRDAPSQAEALASTGGDVAAAAALLKKSSGDKIDKAIAEDQLAPKGSKRVKQPKQKKEAPTREAGLVKISSVTLKKPKRTSADNEGKVWLKGVGVDKSSLKRKMELRKAPAKSMKLIEQKSQYYHKNDMRELLPCIFDDEDKAVIKAPEKHSELALRYAKDARAAAERVLCAIKGESVPAIAKL